MNHMTMELKAVNFFDLIGELIQNAIDSAERDGDQEGAKTGRIVLELYKLVSTPLNDPAMAEDENHAEMERRINRATKAIVPVMALITTLQLGMTATPEERNGFYKAILQDVNRMVDQLTKVWRVGNPVPMDELRERTIKKEALN